MKKRPGIFNDVIGPVMRGPSSSHTAGVVRIGRVARKILGKQPEEANITFGRTTSQENRFAIGFAPNINWQITW